jgi:hypothetical protein
MIRSLVAETRELANPSFFQPREMGRCQVRASGKRVSDCPCNLQKPKNSWRKEKLVLMEQGSSSVFESSSVVPRYKKGRRAESY